MDDIKQQKKGKIKSEIETVQRMRYKTQGGKFVLRAQELKSAIQ